MKVFINPGHSPGGRPDPGAINPNNGVRECDIVILYALLLEQHLNVAGIETRRLQVDDLREITMTSNLFESDIFISIHCNACLSHNGRGVETWYNSIKGKTIAERVQSAVVEANVGLVDRGIKQTDNLFVLNATMSPAILIELGFIDNDDDLKILQDQVGIIAKSIADAIISLRE